MRRDVTLRYCLTKTIQREYFRAQFVDPENVDDWRIAAKLNSNTLGLFRLPSPSLRYACAPLDACKSIGAPNVTVKELSRRRRVDKSCVDVRRNIEILVDPAVREH